MAYEYSVHINKGLHCSVNVSSVYHCYTTAGTTLALTRSPLVWTKQVQLHTAPHRAQLFSEVGGATLALIRSVRSLLEMLV